MKKGDIFSWSYQSWVYDERQDSVQAGTLYWCCSRIAIFDGEYLRDNYWGGTHDDKRWTPGQAEEELVLTYIANENELEPCTCPEYYDEVFDLTHPNSSGKKMYIKKGAQKSRNAMMQLAHNRLEETLENIEYLKGEADRLQTKLDEIKSSNDLNKVYI